MFAVRLFITLEALIYFNVAQQYVGYSVEVAIS